MNAAGDSRLAIESAEEVPESEPPQRLDLLIVREDGDWSPFGELDGAVRRAAGALARHPDCRLDAGMKASIVLASDGLVRRLNRAYRHRDCATNVLSFPYQKPAAGVRAEENYLGDVILAAQTTYSEAVERGIEPVAHLQHLVVHGLLHLIGSDHRDDAEAEAMEALETQILASIGVADPHAAI